MPEKHPYSTTLKAVPEIVGQLRKSFPATVDSSTIKKYGIAPKNESYLINILKYLKLIGEDGSRTETAQKVFTLHSDPDFQAEFSNIVRSAYDDLFALYNDDAWTLDEDKLISFFRNTDQSTENVGTLQAKTFTYLSLLSGKTEVSQKAVNSVTRKPRSKPQTKPGDTTSKKSATGKAADSGNEQRTGRDSSEVPLNLTLRIEINLPGNGDKETYDHIFASLKRNIIDGLRTR